MPDKTEGTTQNTDARKGYQRDFRPKRLPTVLTEEEQEALLKQPNQQRREGLRNLCLLRLMLNTGLRPAEVLNIKVNDIDWRRGKMMVREGKGKKDRTLWIGKGDLEILKKWLKLKAQLPESEFLFTTHDGKRLLNRYLRTMVKRLLDRPGLTRMSTPTCCATLLQQISFGRPKTSA